MQETTNSNSSALRDEIISVGARAANQTPERYLATAATSQIVKDLRRAAESDAVLSPTLALLLKLDDLTFAYAIAGLREGAADDGAKETAKSFADLKPFVEDGYTAAEAKTALALALAESYLTNHHLSFMVEAATAYLSATLKRLEKHGVVLESDAASRDALALLGAYNLWREDPNSPIVNELLNELSERVKPAPPTAAVAASDGDA